MVQIKVAADNFNLSCRYVCCVMEVWDHEKDDYIAASRRYISDHAVTASKTVAFNVNIPDGAVIEKAQLHAKVGLPYTPLYGSKVSTINGIEVGAGCAACVDIEIPSGATTVEVPFRFLCNEEEHTSHSPNYGSPDYKETYGTKDYEYYYFPHDSTMSYADVYLLIEYTPPFTPPTLIPYTDPRLYVGETYVKAVHMTELHTNANLVRTAYHLPAYDFPPIVAGESLLARWNEDVIELRVALDEIGVEHEEWLVLDFNRPRLDVLLQLRRVVAALARGGEQEETDGVQLYTADGALLMDANGLYFKAWEGN